MDALFSMIGVNRFAIHFPKALDITRIDNISLWPYTFLHAFDICKPCSLLHIVIITRS